MQYCLPSLQTAWKKNTALRDTQTFCPLPSDHQVLPFLKSIFSFMSMFRKQQTGVSIFLNPFISSLLQKYGPDHITTSKSQMFIIPLQSSWPRCVFLEGLAPVNKELPDKARNGNCLFLL